MQARYLVVNRLAEPVTLPLADKRPAAALYLAFVEVVLTLLQQSDEVRIAPDGVEARTPCLLGPDPLWWWWFPPRSDG